MLMPDNKDFCQQNNDVHCVFRSIRRTTVDSFHPSHIVDRSTVFLLHVCIYTIGYVLATVWGFFLLQFSTQTLYGIVNFVFRFFFVFVWIFCSSKWHLDWKHDLIISFDDCGKSFAWKTIFYFIILNVVRVRSVQSIDVQIRLKRMYSNVNEYHHDNHIKESCYLSTSNMAIPLFKNIERNCEIRWWNESCMCHWPTKKK